MVSRFSEHCRHQIHDWWTAHARDVSKLKIETIGPDPDIPEYVIEYEFRFVPHSPRALSCSISTIFPDDLSMGIGTAAEADLIFDRQHRNSSTNVISGAEMLQNPSLESCLTLVDAVMQGQYQLHALSVMGLRSQYWIQFDENISIDPNFHSCGRLLENWKKMSRLPFISLSSAKPAKWSR